MSKLAHTLNFANIPSEWKSRIMWSLKYQEQGRIYPYLHPRSRLIPPGEKTFIEGFIDNFFATYNYTTHLTVHAGDTWRHASQAVELGTMMNELLFLRRVEYLILHVKVKCGVLAVDGVANITETLEMYPRLKVAHVNLILPRGWVNADEGEFYAKRLRSYASGRTWDVEVSVVWVDEAARLLRWLQLSQLEKARDERQACDQRRWLVADWIER